MVQDRIYTNMNCVSAYRLIPHSKIASLVDTVRNRILSFVLEIESEAPDAGEAAPNTSPVPQEKVQKVFNTYIMGNVGNIASGSEHVSQIAIIQVPVGDFDALKKNLEQLGVESDEIEELEKAINQDRKKTKDERIGDKTGGWIGRVLTKASTGALKAGTSVASDIITKSISQYLGLS